MRASVRSTDSRNDNGMAPPDMFPFRPDSDESRQAAGAAAFPPMGEKKVGPATRAISGNFDAIRRKSCLNHKLSVCFFQVQQESTARPAAGFPGGLRNADCPGDVFA